MEKDRDLIRARLAHARGEGPRPEAQPAFVYVGRELLVPATFTTSIEDTRRGYRVELTIDAMAPSPVCRTLTMERLDGGPIRRTDLQKVPLATWIDKAISQVAFTLEAGAAIFDGAPIPRRRTVDPDHLRRVAAVYRRAMKAKRTDPTKAVAEELDLGRRTAARHVKTARDRGFLGEAIDRRPGEKPSRSRKRKR